MSLNNSLKNLTFQRFQTLMILIKQNLELKSTQLETQVTGQHRSLQLNNVLSTTTVI